MSNKSAGSKAAVVGKLDVCQAGDVFGDLMQNNRQRCEGPAEQLPWDSVR